MMEYREHCPICGRFMAGHWPVYTCKVHGVIMG